MKRIFYTGLFVINLGFVYSQTPYLTCEKFPELKYLGLTGSVFYKSYSQVKGSAYLWDEWKKGSVKLNDGTVYSDIDLKIDIYEHRLLFFHSLMNRIIKLDKEPIAEFSISDGEMLRRFVKIDKLATNANEIGGYYAEVLNEGKLSFYKLFYKDKLPLSNPQKPFIDVFIDEKAYFLSYNGEYHKVNLRKSVIIKAMPERKEEINKFIRGNHIRIRKQADFSKVVSFINE